MCEQINSLVDSAQGAAKQLLGWGIAAVLFGLHKADKLLAGWHWAFINHAGQRGQKRNQFYASRGYGY